MDDFQQDGLDEDLIKFAIQESIQDACKPPCAMQTSALGESVNRGWLPLHYAAVHFQPEILSEVLREIVAKNQSLEVLTEDGDTALTLAAESGLVDNVKLLLQHGALPHNANGRNDSPLIIAVRQKSYSMAVALILGGAFVQQVCHQKRTAAHEAAKVGCPKILNLLLRHGARVSAKDGHGVTPMGLAAEHGHPEVLDILIQQGGDVNAKAYNGDTVLYDAAGSGNLDCIKLLLLHGANPNVASQAYQLPIHRAAYEGHIGALRILLSITTRRAIVMSGHNPIHSAADGGQPECLKLLIERGFDVNSVLQEHISENYGDFRRSPLYFAISNGHVTCAKMLLEAGARTDLDPLRCILVAVRAESYELVKLLVSYSAEVNCYFNVLCNTVFPTALQYCLRDHPMLTLLLNGGYQAEKCFQCCHGEYEKQNNPWVNLRNQVYQNYSEPDVITFCEFVSVPWLTHVVGSVVRTLLDYVSYVSICPKLRHILEKRPEWEDIADILNHPRSLQHLCRLVIRRHMSPRTLNDPETIAAVPFPPALKNYLTYRDYDLYGYLSSNCNALLPV